jgi:hypothetical protein
MKMNRARKWPLTIIKWAKSSACAPWSKLKKSNLMFLENSFNLLTAFSKTISTTPSHLTLMISKTQILASLRYIRTIEKLKMTVLTNLVKSISNLSWSKERTES